MLKPLSEDWNYETAAHLLNRAGFGGPPAEIDRLADLGQDPAVSVAAGLRKDSRSDAQSRLGRSRPGADAERCATSSSLDAGGQESGATGGATRASAADALELRGWWLQAHGRGPRPFQEKMVLFWHGHFATSVEKVRDAYYMWRQNELFRRLATGNWQQLLADAGKDPAMLIWLDQAQSRKEHPNENFAREVMELFALGEGHYTEHDITEAARALTGWSLDRQNEQYIYRPLFHDNGDKTFLGRTGNLDGDDVIAQIVAQPQAARFITAQAVELFRRADAVGGIEHALAGVFRANGNNFKPFLRVMFRSEEFYARRHRPQPGEKPGAMARRQRADAGMRPAADARELGMLRSWARICSRRRTSRAGTAASPGSPRTRCCSATTTPQALVQGTIPPLTAADFARKPGGAGRLTGRKKLLQRVRMGGVDVEKILTPGGTRRQGHARRRRCNTVCCNPRFQRAGAGVARISGCQNQDDRCGHSSPPSGS